MSEKRQDSKRRILKNGESQRSDGRYCYKYLDELGKSHFLYSWKLLPTDKLPKDKKECKSLRELEKELQLKVFKGIDISQKSITVLELAEKHLEQLNVRHNTKKVI
ncbi:Integrase [Lachnospiraceae bacterium TWA4]|nr:Integrase [Lachnospiraceae bacterium TWA4]